MSPKKSPEKSKIVEKTTQTNHSGPIPEAQRVSIVASPPPIPKKKESI